MKKLGIVVLTCLLQLSSIAQEQFDLAEMEQVLLEEINKIRTEKNLKNLALDEVLNAAAFDQAEFILKNGKLSHIQNDKRKAKLMDRIIYYKGLNAQAGENIAMINYGMKVEVDLKKTRSVANNPELLIKGAITSWLKEDDGALNILDPNYFLAGVSTLRTEQNAFIFVFVGANLPYEMPAGVKPNFNNHGIEGDKENACSSFLEKHGTLPQLFSDAFKVEGQEVFLEYHDLAFVEEILDGGGDGIAIEFVQKDQFNCGESNRLFPGNVARGELYPPARKGKLSVLNSKKEEGAVKISLGEIPSYYSPSSTEINGLIIKDGNLCARIPYNRVKTENKRWLGFPYLFAGEAMEYGKEISDSSSFYFDIGTIEQLKNANRILDNYLGNLSYQLQEVLIDFTASPGHEDDLNANYLEEHFQAVFDKYFKPDEMSITYQFHTDWEQYEKFKKGTFYQLETEGMEQHEVKDYLVKTMKEDTKLKKALGEMKTLKIQFRGSMQFTDSVSFEDRYLLYKSLLMNNKLSLAEQFQRQLLEEVEGDMSRMKEFEPLDLPQEKSNLNLINNELVLATLKGEKTYGANQIHKAFLELHLIHPGNPIVRYNYHLSLLKHWSGSNKRIKDIAKWKKKFELLRAVEFPKDAFARAYVNYSIIAADYYFDTGEFDYRRKAFDNVLRYARPAKLTPNEILDIAKYLCYQDQYTRAIELLLPHVGVEKPDQQLLQYFLQIAIYVEDEVEPKNYLKYLEKYQNLFPKEFCALFSNDQMGFQALLNEDIKMQYCATCKN